MAELTLVSDATFFVAFLLAANCLPLWMDCPFKIKVFVQVINLIDSLF